MIHGVRRIDIDALACNGACRATGHHAGAVVNAVCPVRELRGRL